MQQALIKVVCGDADYPLNFTLTDAAGNVVNLSGLTSLTFNAQSVVDGAVQTSGAMSVVSAGAGTCYYTVQATDFPIAGNYNVQIVVLYVSGEKVTFSDILVVAESRIPD